MQPPKTAGPRDTLPQTSRYELLVKIAAGGMATVYVGRSTSRREIRRLFAIKRAHAHLADDPVFRAMFVAEARLASKIHHPNVVAVQDVEELEDELLLVMDYVEGVSLAGLRPLTEDARARTRLAVRIVLDACAGLHAAHELEDDRGEPLHLVHRDVSPHNVLVGLDGVTRLTDFGIAKRATHTAPRTVTGGLKGKLGYMAPEYVETGRVDRRADVFGLGVVLWEALTRARLFEGDVEVDVLRAVAACRVAPPSAVTPGLSAELDDVVLTALAREPDARFETAADFAAALEAAARDADLIASHAEVANAVAVAAGDALQDRRTLLREAPSVPDEGAGVDADFGLPAHEKTRTLSPSAAPSPPSAPLASAHAHSDATRADVAPARARARAPGRLRLFAAAVGAFGLMGGLAVALPRLVAPRASLPGTAAASDAPPVRATTMPAAVPAPSSAAADHAGTISVDDLPVAPAGTGRQRRLPGRGGAGAKGTPSAAPPVDEAPASSTRAPPNPYRDGGPDTAR